MPVKFHSEPIESKAADADEASTSATSTLRIMLMDASAELAQSRSDETNWGRNYVRVAHWIARQVPLWRELVSKNRAVQADPDAPSALEVDSVLKLIDGFLTDLSARAPQAVRDRERHAAIEKAKQEWECTADALTAMVCLLDADGLILRANRVVEHWGLGSVGVVVGKRAHAVLHPDCTHASCRVAQWLQGALPKLRGGDPQEFEFYSPAGDQTLQFTLRPMRIDDAAAPEPPDTRSVLVVTDVSALRRAQKALENVNLNLESRVRVRTRELDESNRDLRKEVERREHAEHELRASRNNLALLSEQLIQAQEGERRRIALELHDSVGQSLSAIKYTLERAIIMVQRPNLGSPESVLTLAVQRIHETADSIRAISMNLRPQLLDNLGAASAASWFCRGFAEVYPTLQVHAEITTKNDEIPKRISTHVYRCLQELLNNVVKHAQANTVWVRLMREDAVLSLEVRDDGIGMANEVRDPARLHGAGLRNLRERAEMTAGEFTIASSADGGTTAQIVWRLGADESVVDTSQ
ncbi:MAG: sensor histidine kinase [Steroidobacteraceae bacterium]